jgi:hypothetical protein
VQTHLAYLETRQAQLQYPQFVADGWPIGSGMVESANKLVVEDRLKGAGMHWAEANVNPMLALRNAFCTDRWAEAWQVIEQGVRQHSAERRSARRATRTGARVAGAPGPAESPVPRQPPVKPAEPPPAPEPALKPPHPWRRAWSVRRQREMANAA